MAETTADVRRDIELTRERMSTTLAQLEQKLNIMQIVKDNPWPALALAVGAGVLLSGSRADVKAAAATADIPSDLAELHARKSHFAAQEFGACVREVAEERSEAARATSAVFHPDYFRNARPRM